LRGGRAGRPGRATSPPKSSNIRREAVPGGQVVPSHPPNPVIFEGGPFKGSAAAPCAILGDGNAAKALLGLD
jgi:hypothetical protein